MEARRASGILLHVSSLPGPHGIGDLGPEAYEFVDSLVRAGQGIWQVLPLGPTGFADSPYQSFSAFAGNASFIDLRELRSHGWLTEADLAGAPAFSPRTVMYDEVTPWRADQLRRAFSRFQLQARPEDQAAVESFRADNRYWLPDYALFQALKDYHGGVAWTKWPRPLIARQPKVIEAWTQRLAKEIEFYTFVQWCFFRQWLSLKEYANARGVRIVGDVPIFVAHDSADVWANPTLFQLDEHGQPRFVAGVPPDYFSATGQLWGNPLYDWDRLAALGYDWWLRRLRQATQLFDLVRLDHFRGFAAHWEVPGDALTAAAGRWAPGPGETFFTAAIAQLGTLPLIAEDLGVITPQVEALRDQFQWPGMRILQFAFGDDPLAPHYRPHNFLPNCVVYTGTHDNDTTVGWFRSEAGEGTTRSAEQIAREREHVLRYLNADGRQVHLDFIRLAMASVARLAIYPMQDVLGLGTEARMNLPSTTAGNWRWRLLPGQFTATHEQQLKLWATTFERELFPPPAEKTP